MWDTFILNPMINALLILYDLLANNFVVAIAVFTLLIRLLTLPLNLRQQRATMRMQEMQPEIQRIQKKYKDNPQKMQEEFQRIGYNPAESLLGCLPLLIQFPILIGLYRAILVVMGSTPQALLELTQRVYEGIDLTRLLPVDNHFLWMNLAQADPYFVLPILVFATTFASQKLMSARKPKDEKTPEQKRKEKEENPMSGMTESMMYTMPLMFGVMSLSFPAGLSIYFVLSNIVGVGQGMLLRRSMPAPGAAKGPPEQEAIPEPEPIPEPQPASNGSSRKAAASKKKRKRRKR
ncbi:MAG: YidC/Oxa1 family membrane protein insertase [Anaerolineae bacterium]|nr:YidC/Oxa1 family membrane protein insertase [Anaerolineae bacterium]